jgi:protein-tyrosine kinase
MERIREAIELAKAKGLTLGVGDRPGRPSVQSTEPRAAKGFEGVKTLATDPTHLEAMRVVAQRAAHPMAPAFDILRTSVLQLMDTHGWQTIAVSSPTAGCGKTVTAINLAMSIARMPGRHVVLLDFDLRRPLVGSYLGVRPKAGLFQLLSGMAPAEDCMAQLDVTGHQLTVIPNPIPIDNPAELIASREVHDLLNWIKNSGQKPIVVMDTPPMLVCDDVLALLPIIDCITLTIAEKMSKAREVLACEHHLKSVNYLGLVLTKSQELGPVSYY